MPAVLYPPYARTIIRVYGFGSESMYAGISAGVNVPFSPSTILIASAIAPNTDGKVADGVVAVSST